LTIVDEVKGGVADADELAVAEEVGLVDADAL
jgi:hypothetical protein